MLGVFTFHIITIFNESVGNPMSAKVNECLNISILYWETELFLAIGWMSEGWNKACEEGGKKRSELGHINK